MVWPPQKVGFKACHSCWGLDPPHGLTDAAVVKKKHCLLAPPPGCIDDPLLTVGMK